MRFQLCERHNYIHSTSNDIHTDGARTETGEHKGIRGDRKFKGKEGYPLETSYHFMHQNTKNDSANVFHEVLHEVATIPTQELLM